MQPSNSNLKEIAECALPQTYAEVHAFLSLVDHYQWFIKGFMCITQPLNEHLTDEGASRKLEGTLKAFEGLKKACLTASILAYADYTKPFLLESDASKDGLGAVLSQKETDEWYSSSGLWQQSPYAS